MLSQRLPMPGPAFGPYPQRQPSSARHRAARAQERQPAARAGPRQGFVAAVRGALATLPPPGSAAHAQALRDAAARLGRDGFGDDSLVPAFALAAQALQATLGLQPYDTQILAARVLLDERLAEMATGEGKTLAAALAAAAAALAGVPVHVVTANPYLAARDAQALAPAYAALGLRATAVAPLPPGADGAAPRRDAYAHEIVYATARELVFDYLRDRLAPPTSPPRLRGLCMAIVDEADSVLIDEARTPFVLAAEVADPMLHARLAQALALARPLQPGRDWQPDPAAARARLTAAGRERLQRLALEEGAAPPVPADPLWRQRRHRDELVELALTALHLKQRDRDFVIRERGGRVAVEIVDATTGRVAEGRRWGGGLHQLVELAQGLPPSGAQQTQAQLTFQRFFPRYWRLCGMSGTLAESRRELRRVYGLAVERVPLRLPARRSVEPPRVYASATQRWDAVLHEVVALQRAGAAVLVGTDSVADAEHLSARLRAAGVDHRCLHARQDADEADCIARAGQAGAVTVATNMAGRGTDIRLGPGVAERGGLHVIACQHNASARIDRQLHGRCARGGEPGRVRTLLSLQEGLLAERLPGLLSRPLGWLCRGGRPLPAPLARVLLRTVQGLEEARARHQRALMLDAEQRLLRGLGFGARNE